MYVCTVCHQTMFSQSNQTLQEMTIFQRLACGCSCCYIYVCGSECAPSCLVPVEKKEQQICCICDSHLLRGQMFSIAIANKMALSPIPAELHQLNALERQLIAEILPFAKIISLPKGQQKAVHGAVVYLPPEVDAAVNALLRPKDKVQLPQVKLKKNIKYKGYQHCDTVNMVNVLAALSTLKESHSEYKDISVDHNA